MACGRPIAAWLAQVRADKLRVPASRAGSKTHTLQATTPNMKKGWVKYESYVNYAYDEEAKALPAMPITPGILGSIFQYNKALQSEQP